MTTGTSFHSQQDLIRSALMYERDTLAFSDMSSHKGNLTIAIDTLFAAVSERIKHIHTDARRTINEYNGEDFSVQQFDVHSADVPLGNHFHKKGVGPGEPDPSNLGKLSEMFVFDEGKGLLLLQDLGPDGNVSGKIQEFSIRARDIIVIPPFQAHTFFLDPGTKFRGFRPYPFDEKDMDMNPHKLERPIK